MNDSLLEELLWEDEGPSLDFKRDQYAFAGEPGPVKAKLLKDILAFANSWRRSTAYILIGVDDVVGGRGKLVGVKSHLADAALQQFVNGKTNRPVEFRYKAYELEGVQLGVVEVPVQERPTFLIKDFEPLRRNVVYVRRGSSTDEADPTEVAKMGASRAEGMAEPLQLEVAFADTDDRKVIGRALSTSSLHLSPRVDPEVLKPRVRPGPFGVMADVGRPKNPSFYEDFVEFVAHSVLLNKVGLCVKNAGQRVARGVELVVTIEDQPGLYVWDSARTPEPPDRYFMPPLMNVAGRFGRPTPTIEVSSHGTNHQVSVRWETVLPGATGWSDGYFLLGSERDTSLTGSATVFAEDLPRPLEVEFTMAINVEKKPMDADMLRGLLGEGTD